MTTRRGVGRLTSTKPASSNIATVPTCASPHDTGSPGSVRIGEVDMPPGTEVAHSPYALHRTPTLYSEAGRFLPERWLDAAHPIPRGAYIPFGNGSRKCIGDAFAWTELVVVTATILQRWRIDPAPGHRTREVPAGMPRPHALPVLVTERSEQ